jgi:uncharacterized iron-regulated membrane protein
MRPEVHPRPSERKNRRLAQVRRWHKWGGLLAGLLLLVSGTTGIVLNYKQSIFTRLGVELKRGERDTSPLPANKSPNKIKLTTDAGISGGAVDFALALAIARAEWGDVPLERVELRSERGSVSYRFRKSGGAELWVDAADGARFAKGEYERIGKSGPDGVPVRSMDWGRILMDVHTGKLGGAAGKAVMTCGALLLILLALSGFCMWIKAILIRRCNSRTKARLALPAPAPLYPNSPAPSR